MMKSDLTNEQLFRAASPEVVNVHVPIGVMWDFDAATKLKKEILGRLGCLACTSGFDIRWRTRREFVVNPQLNVVEMTELGGFQR
jgi:hypothetical protein